MKCKYLRQLILISIAFFSLGIGTSFFLNPYPPLKCENSYRNDDEFIDALEQWLIVFYKENPDATNIDALAKRDAHYKKIGCGVKTDL